jgi:serpin B
MRGFRVESQDNPQGRIEMTTEQPRERRTKRGTIVGLACLFLSACAALVLGLTASSGGAAPVGTAGHGSARSGVVTAPPRAGRALPAISPAKPLSPGEGFGLDLLGTQPPGNVVVSPASVAVALAMAGTGAGGSTAAEMAATLGLKGPARFDALGALLRKTLAGQAAAAGESPDAPTLAIADGLFVQQGFALKSPFVEGLQRHFGATPEAVDFLGDPDAALAAINAWGSAHTNGIIPQMLGGIPAETRLVLADAIYLKAEWRRKFEAEDTFPGTFHRSNGKPAKAEFMYQEDRFRYGVGPGYKAVELPYRASNLSLLAVLPVGTGVSTLERRLRTSGRLGPIVHGLASETVRLSLPRFHLRAEASLVAPLQALGMKAAFTEAADFSGIAAEPLMIGAIQHDADIQVDEEGTEAAATTGIVVVPTSAAVPRESVVFNANRPFLFFVRDDKTGAILFAGRITDPSAVAPQ